MNKDYPVVVVDADGLIALFNPHDQHADQAMTSLQQLQSQGAWLIYPATTIVEATTTLQRKLSQPQLAAAVVRLINQHELTIEPVNQEILKSAAQLFTPSRSKHHTLFDAIVAAIAKKYQAQAIFSFDKWYAKLGFTLVKDL